MKTYDFPIKDLFNKGLRPTEESPRGGSFLTAISNARIENGGLIQVDKYIRAFPLNTYAQVFSAYKGIFVLTQDTLYEYRLDTLTSLLTGLMVGNMWSMADFGDYILFANGNVNLIRNPTTGIFTIDNGTIFPLARTICAHRGRLILGGLENYPTAGINHFNWVAWSNIGELDFISSTDRTQIQQNLSGYMPMPWEGHVLRVLPLNDKLIVYGEDGIVAMPLVSTEIVASTYGKIIIDNIGINQEKSVITNGRKDNGIIHYFVDSLGDIKQITSDLNVTFKGYKEFLI